MPQHIDSEGRVHSPYAILGADAPVPVRGFVLVASTRFLAEPAFWLARHGGFGIILKNTESPLVLEPYLANIGLVALEFPLFTDGRAYSQARLLRVRLGYAGRLHATGQLAIDQVRELFSCGFDSLELPEHWKAEHVLTLRGLISVSYQDWCRDPALA